MNIEEVENYYNELVKKRGNNAPDFALNSDRVHNSTILRFMLDSSQEINMYCGEMSVLKQSFYEKIETEAEDGDVSRHLIKKLEESIESFLEKESTLFNIYVENLDVDTIKDELITKKLINKKIKIYVINKDWMLSKDMSHISYTDSSIVRMEKPQSHEATCSINTPEDIMQNWRESFKMIKLAAQEVKLEN